MHLDGDLPALSIQFPGRDNPLHHLHIFHRRRFYQLVTDNTTSAVGGGSINFLHLQKMVGDLDSSFLFRIAALFLGLPQTAQSSSGLVVLSASDRGCRIYSPVFRRSFLTRDESAFHRRRAEHRRTIPGHALDGGVLYVDTALRSQPTR